ncbi:RNA polymerase sigma factor [Candidatus Viridilinea mediisalina]|uniref:RNA polymerase subunit sigma-24 n=1 Tax=Candidatus Viridilinea mediisalina TaxID=2024553 RepID=A0A2A6RIZ2_9CHLR|nr:sigma-70 family RNA polymerase sigma factor [Candidatus Viridilinea mediisalina]PDW02855.1 RNA polymerase subunit sigma-24 [Candidatus Viridilinea mediisalina]
MPGPVIDLSVYADETALLEGLRRRDPDACTCLMKRFTPLVYARALRLTGDPDEAEGVLQTTFIKVCEALPRFDGASSLSTWIYRIATNEGLMLLRQRRPRVDLDALAETLQPDDLPQANEMWSPDPLRAALNGELRNKIEQAIASLPEPLRLVLVLRDLEALSTEETAAHLGISPGAVKVRLHRARTRLREMLAHYLATHPEAETE